MFYPLKFQPVYKNYLWGGRNLERFGKTLPAGLVAESWEISCHPNGVSTISNGEFTGIPLTDLIASHSKEIVGTGVAEKKPINFPLLIKLIDANDKLSVQVHPDDAYAVSHENGEPGKNEMWYILETRPGAELIYDVRPETTRESFALAIQNCKIGDCLKHVPVKPGDIINIPAGLVHAIGAGIVLVEIQQNSDITYRVYDYDRVDASGNRRPLHIEKALDVINFKSKDRPAKTEGLAIKLSQGIQKRHLVANPYFAVELYDIQGKLTEIASGVKFYIYLFTEGSGEILYDSGSIPVTRGESVLIPAMLGQYTIKGNLQALKAYVPDLLTEIVAPLMQAGYTEAKIYQQVGGLKR